MNILSLLPVAAATPDVASGLTIGGVLLAIGVGAFWAGLHLRGRTYSRLKSSVDLAHSGLAERAIEYFRALQVELATVLPDPSEAFDPLDVILDPARLEEPAVRGVKIFRQQQRLTSQFPLLLRVCTALKVVGIIFPFLVVGGTASYLLLFDQSWIWQTGIISVIAVAAVAVILIGAYGVLDSRIEKAIEDADSTRAPGGVS